MLKPTISRTSWILEERVHMSPSPTIVHFLQSPHGSCPPSLFMRCENIDLSPVTCLAHPLSRYHFSSLMDHLSTESFIQILGTPFILDHKGLVLLKGQENFMWLFLLHKKQIWGDLLWEYDPKIDLDLIIFGFVVDQHYFSWTQWHACQEFAIASLTTRPVIFVH